MKKTLMLVLLAVLVGALAAPAIAQQQKQQQGQLQNAERLSQVIGKTARTQQGQELGKVEDIISDRQGRNLYLILSGDKVGKSNEYIPVPWQAAQPQIRQDQLTLNIEQQRLQNAPSFPQDNWGQFNQVEQRVNSYFGAAGAGQQQGQQQRTPNQQKMTPGQKGAK